MIIDHLIYTAPDLATGMDAIEALVGIRPAFGGQHPQWGTHNALLSLGKRTYLEVLAPDPSLPAPPRGRWLIDACQQGPRLSTWALGVTDIKRAVQQAKEVGLQVGSIQAGSRSKANGRVLRWQLTDPYALPAEGALPFLIDWGDTPHPGCTTPPGVELLDFRIGHPAPPLLQTVLEGMGLPIPVKTQPEATLTAQLRVDGRTVLLR